MAICIAGVIFIVISSTAFLPSLEATCYNVEGLIVTVFTGADQNGSVVLDNVPQMAQFLKDSGVDGVMVASTTGEGPSINTTDNKRLLDAWMAVAKPLKLFVISSVGATPLPFTLEMTRYSEEIGVDAIFYLPEAYFKPNCAEELVDDMLLIAEAAPNTPLVYDDIPSVSKVEVDIEEFFELATKKIPNFRGVKSEVLENLLILKDKTTGDQKIYVNNYINVAPLVGLEFKNFVLKELNLFPKEISEIIKSGEKGNLTETYTLYKELLDLIEVITKNGKRTCEGTEDTCAATKLNSRLALQRSLKAAMPLVTGIDMGPVFPPIVPFTEEEEQDLEQRLKEAGVPIVISYNDNFDK